MKQKILIVEDNGDIRENTTELLELSDYSVSTANNGEEGLDAALQEMPDLILCDVQMPVMNGYELLVNVRKQPSLKNSRFVFFTASREKKEIETGMQMGADDYLIKPFTGEELLGKLKKLLGSILLFISLSFESLQLINFIENGHPPQLNSIHNRIHNL